MTLRIAIAALAINLAVAGAIFFRVGVTYCEVGCTPLGWSLEWQKR